MPHLQTLFISLLCLVIPSPTPAQDNPDIATLMEDDAENLLPKLNNPTGDSGQGFVEAQDCFSGKAAIRITPLQRFSPKIAGWNYKIVEKPGPGEYRYLRFAWKADAARGIMLQFHDEKDWTMRLTAGIDAYGWGTKFVAPAPPTKWTVVTSDLFREFGQHTIQGNAFTVFDGKAGYFDHVYLARSLEELDAIDATGLAKGPPVALNAEKLDQLWADLADEDDAKAYLAFWTLRAGVEQSADFLVQSIQKSGPSQLEKQIKIWITELDADQFTIREKASQNLAENLQAAAGELSKTLEDPPSAEVRERVQRLLSKLDARNSKPPKPARALQAIKILTHASPAKASAAFEAIIKQEVSPDITAAARHQLEKLRAQATK